MDMVLGLVVMLFFIALTENRNMEENRCLEEKVNIGRLLLR